MSIFPDRLMETLDRLAPAIAALMAATQTYPAIPETVFVVLAVGIAYLLGHSAGELGRHSRGPSEHEKVRVAAAQLLVLEDHDLTDEVAAELETGDVLERATAHIEAEYEADDA